jgi:PKHD-type hydroxylase
MRNARIIKPVEKPAFVPFVQWSGENAMLSVPECEWLVARGEQAPLAFASVGTPTIQRTELSTRCVESTALDEPDCDWLYTRIAERVQWANKDFFDFDLTGLIEPVQFLKYTPAKEEKPDGHYTWHVDFGEGAMATRKLSLIIQLSPPTAYDGCGLVMNADRGPFEPGINGQGSAILFPSWSPHMVKPITRGIRYALVAWIHGPRFR